MHKQGKLPERSAVFSPDHSTGSEMQRTSCLRIVEKDSLKFPVGKKALDQSFVLSGTGNVIPAVGGTVGYDGIKFDKMDMKAHDIRQGFYLERAFFQKFREKIGKPDLNTVTCIGADD